MSETFSFGEWVALRRKALDMTQRTLAAQSNCALATIKKIEQAERHPSRDLAEAMARALRIPIDTVALFVECARGVRSADVLAAIGHAGTAQNHDSQPAMPVVNLPAQSTLFIGREAELSQIAAYLDHAGCRLLTLTGPGGIGKTRLGLQVAAELIDAFPDGVSFVDLAPIRDPALVISAIAQTLEIKETGGQPLIKQLKQFLGNKRMLLLLDNFEHVLDAAPLLAELLAAASQLKLLVTSRSRLHLRGEKEVTVLPLALPERTTLPPLDQLAHYSAVALFIQRASDARPNFQLTNANAATVAEICARLEGIPLAIELAAARSKLFAPEALLARLSSPLALLTGGARDLPARQQTIRSTIAWSYDLLSEAEQMLFRRLGVFVGGCTLAAAEGVLRTEGRGLSDGTMDSILSFRPSVLDGLAALVDKTLLRQIEGPDGDPRFVMLETIREYALERLEASGEAEQLSRQHASYYEAFSFEQPAEDIDTYYRRVDRDYDNVRSALEWSEMTAGDSEAALRLAGALIPLWSVQGNRHKAIVTLKRILAHPLGVGHTVAHGRARVELGNFLALTGNYAAAQAEYEQALPLVREIGDSWLHGWALHYLGRIAREQSDSATAWARLSQSLAIFRKLDDAHCIAEALNTLAEVAILDEDPGQAEALLAESRVIEPRGNADTNTVGWTLGWTLNHLGHAAQLRGAFNRAAQLHHESLECFQAFGDQHFGLPWAYHGLGETALGLGRLNEATRWLTQGLALSQTLSDQASISWCLAGLGCVAALDEEPERAARLWGAAERQRQAIGCRPPPAARATYERAVAMVRAQLDDDAFAAAWEVGRALTLQQAIAEAVDDAAEAPIN